jgi:hypothetical protein
VGVLVAVIVWFASHSYLAPLIAGAAVIGFGQLTSGVYQEQAWAFIPRKRQDRQRPLPVAWELGSGLVLAALLVVALVLVAFRLDQPDVPDQVRELTFGMGAAAGLLVVVDARLLRRRGHTRRRVLYALPGAIAVVASLGATYGVLFGSAGPGSPATVLWGAAAMLAAGVAVGIARLVPPRQSHPFPTGRERR